MSFPIWSDLNDDALIPPLGTRKSPDVKSQAVMVSTDLDFRLIASKAAALKISDLKITPFFMSSLMTAGGLGTSFAGPYMGSPYAAMLLESLIARGAEKIIVMGWCGAVSKTVTTGDIIIADAAIADEGTSRNYMTQMEQFPVVYPSDIYPSDNTDSTAQSQGMPSLSLSEKVKARLEANQISCGTGKIWTTDAIYRETEKKIAFFREKGAIAVEMECAALFSVAAFRKKEIAAVLVVSDDVSSSSWKPGFRNRTFKDARKKLAEAMLNLGTL